MERLDYRIADFQTPLLQNISEIQNSADYTNHIHRSIDTLRSLTDRAALNITLTAAQNDPRASTMSPSSHHQHLDTNQTNDERGIQERYLSASLADYHQRHEFNLRHIRGDTSTSQTSGATGQDGGTLAAAVAVAAAADYHHQEQQRRILNLRENGANSSENDNGYQRLDFNRSLNGQARLNNTETTSIDYSGANVKSEFNQQRTTTASASSTTNNRYSDNDFLNRCSDEHFNRNDFHQQQQQQQQQQSLVTGALHSNKSVPTNNAGTSLNTTDAASYSNSSPSSPGTPISIDGSNNFNGERDKVFGSKADLQLHTQMHMREAKPYKCSQCCKAFANSSYLSQHTRIHLGIKPYRCEICQRKFTQLSHLQQHIRTHTGDKPYKCRHPGCQKAFSQLSNLQSHSRCHQTDKPYKCNSCYKCFSDEQSLLEHIPKHKESKHLKTHICQYCGKSYTQETYLQKHMQKHSERVDKRPPIPTAGGALTGLNRNLLAAVSAAGVASLESPYWSKLSPDTMSSLDLERLEYHNHHSSGLTASNAAALLLERNSSTNLGILDRSASSNVQNLHLDHHRANSNYGNQQSNSQQQQQQRPPNGNDANQANSTGENLAENSSTNRTGFDSNTLKTNSDRTSNSTSGAPTNSHENIGEDLVVNNRHCRVNSPVTNENSNIGANSNTTAGAGGGGGGSNSASNNGGVTPNIYDNSNNKSGYEISISRSVTNSAFTPISGINHLNLNHPAMGRPYLYDALSFQNKELNLNLNKSASNSNAFPNQLISLHQIRNYAHQPSSIGSSDHILGLKDK